MDLLAMGKKTLVTSPEPEEIVVIVEDNNISSMNHILSTDDM